jgi:hypothetical protein
VHPEPPPDPNESPDVTLARTRVLLVRSRATLAALAERLRVRDGGTGGDQLETVAPDGGSSSQGVTGRPTR